MKKIYIISSAIGIGLLVGGGVFLWKQQQVPPVQPEVATQDTPALPAMTTWKDAAGFSFAYREDLAVNKHDEDEENYAHVELTSKDHPGSMIAWVKDVPAGVKDAASWVKKEKTFTGATISDTTLGGKPAKRISFSDSKKKEIIGTVFDDVLWYIELAPEDEAYWKPVFNGAVESFTFIPVSDTSGSNAAAGGEESTDDVAVDEEEVLE